MGIIYYLIPDVQKYEFSFLEMFRSIRKRKFLDFMKYRFFVKEKPIGGIKVIYQHCILLKELGYEVYPLLMGDYKGDFFDYNFDYKYIADVGYQLDKNDVIVCPEYKFYQGLQFMGCTKILFNQSQSWRYLDDRLKENDLGKNYYELGYDYVINCSEYLCRMLKVKMNVDSHVITNGVDQEKFHPVPDIRIKNRVLALSRKNPGDLKSVIRASKGLGFKFHVVDGLSENELIKEYQKADIFLSTGYPEGFSLPPLEAMNCGCVVVGYTGGGGDEYMIDDNTALVAKDGAVDEVVLKLKVLIDNPRLKEFIRVNGVEMSKAYSLSNTMKMLKIFYQKV